MYYVTKTYGHELGLSACFRQWKAKSHCRFLHGYALSFKLTFGAAELDENNWVLDFGGLKSVKAWLIETFDHKMLVAFDDPQFARLERLAEYQLSENVKQCEPLADILAIPAVGCEGFAQYVFNYVALWLETSGHAPRVFIKEVEVREHAGNSAIFGA